MNVPQTVTKMLKEFVIINLTHSIIIIIIIFFAVAAASLREHLVLTTASTASVV